MGGSLGFSHGPGGDQPSSTHSLNFLALVLSISAVTASVRACFHSDTALGIIGVGTGVVLLLPVPTVTDIVLLNCIFLVVIGSPTFDSSLLIVITGEFPVTSFLSGVSLSEVAMRDLFWSCLFSLCGIPIVKEILCRLSVFVKSEDSDSALIQDMKVAGTCAPN